MSVRAIGTITAAGPHQGGRVLVRGDLDTARGVCVLLHGRGATAESILALADEIRVDDVVYVAPQAAGRTWYPYRFLEPLSRNEPWLSGALAAVDGLVATLEERGFTPERLALCGFSQGACLGLEAAVRSPRRYGAIIGLSGGLIGPPGTKWPSPRELEGTRVFLGCGDQDDHIPVSRVEESAEVFRRAGADVTAVIYPGMPHTVSEDELRHVRELLQNLQSGSG